MTRRRCAIFRWLFLALLLPATASAQQAGTRSGLPPIVTIGPSTSRPASPALGPIARAQGAEPARHRSDNRATALPRVLVVQPRHRGSRDEFGTRRHSGFGSRDSCGRWCGCFWSWPCAPIGPVGHPLGIATVLAYAYDVFSYAAEPIPEPEKRPTRSKLIVVGGAGAGSGNALAAEQSSDSLLLLTWLGSERSTREVQLFVADSAERRLGAQHVSAAEPQAFFDTARLGAPIGYVGVTVAFPDGVTTTTLVPYRAAKRSTPSR